MTDLKGKSVMIIGGTTDIGARLSHLLAKQGAKLTICGNNQKAGEEFVANIMMKKYSPLATAVFGFINPSDKASVDNAFKKAKTSYGYVHYVVNCASVWDDGQQWTNEVDTNMRGAFLVSMMALEHLGIRKNDKAEGATVINVSSTLAFQPNYLMPIFSATKAAVLKFTRDLGTDFHYGLNKVKFVAVCPSLSKDDQSTFFNLAQTKMVLPFEELFKAWNQVQVSNFQTAEHVASQIEWIMKSDPKNGEVYMIDGGNATPIQPWNVQCKEYVPQ